ncbi:hypothetical protein M422DRAFT_781512 [Sphaerobolus stellatus SS14]|uniref:Zn(2)-C6 fungal-type domain-containing protein n=1 Tax=Sphaerobolus stellatus (strain SS14) TaxID=990650 RepID=A0A0C9V923_SPHS4|nr:hypothetical protein M422DRAFT_781512 [Sphaerobolus stellatus SS14]
MDYYVRVWLFVGTQVILEEGRLPVQATPSSQHKPIGSCDGWRAGMGLRWEERVLASAGLVAPMDSPASIATKRPHPEAEPDASLPPVSRVKRARPKTSKACNACRKQKSRCERLPGDGDGCHRCGVIGIPCIFQTELPAGDAAKERKPRPLLPRGQAQKLAAAGPGSANGENGRTPSPDNSRLHVLANTTEMLSRASTSAQPPPPPVSSSTPKTPLSPQTLSTVESTLLPPQVDPETSRFRADWQRWVAPLTLLQNLVRRNTAPDSHWRQDSRPVEADLLSPSDAQQLKQHFLTHYAPWLPAISLFATATSVPSTISPFLNTVIHATASRTWPTPLPYSTISSLRALSLHHVGQIFANPTSYPVIESLYALLALIMWPLEPADDVTLLIHGAKRMAQSADGGRLGLSANGMYNLAPSNTPPAAANLSTEDLDLIRLWYAICTNETIFTLGAGTIANPPPTTLLSTSLGTPSSIALSNGPIADTLLTLQASLHRVIVGAMGEGTLQSNGSIAGGTGRDGPIRSAQSIPKTREAMLQYVSKVFAFLSKLGEWEIEFKTIKAESPHVFSIHFAMLEIEYHYLTLIYVTHSLLTVCYGIPLTQASDETKCSIWSWSVTGNKAAHRVLELWNKFSSATSEPGSDTTPTSGSGSGISGRTPSTTTPASNPTSPSLSPTLSPHTYPHRPSSRPSSSHVPPPTPLLSLAPDRIYAMVVVAIMLILRHQVAAYEFGRRRSIFESPPAGFTKQAEIAIRRVVRSMGSYSIARSADHRDGHGDGGKRTEHAAVRYAEIIDALLRVWEEKHSAKVYALSNGQGGDGPNTGLFDRRTIHENADVLSCHASGRAETPTTSQGFNTPQCEMDSALPGSCDPAHAQAHAPFHHASQSQSPHQQFHPHPHHLSNTHYTQSQSHPHSHSQHIPTHLNHQSQSHHQQMHPPQNPPHQGPLEMDLSLLGTDLFSDAAAAFAWDGLGSLDWSLGFGTAQDPNAGNGGGYTGHGHGGMGMG